LTSLSRREALLLAAAAPLAAAGSAHAAQPSFPSLLARAHQLELAAAVAYESTAGSGIPGDLAAVFARHERDQATAVQQALEALGARTLDEPESTADVAALVPGLPAAGATADEQVRYLVTVEHSALDVHRSVLGATHHAAVLRTVASVMAAAGTHLAVLRDRLGDPPAATL
jgi:hypothetical protein